MEWYFEYQINDNKPGLLGDVATFLGLLEINIKMINGLAPKTRGLLIRADDHSKIVTLKRALASSNNIEVTAIRRPTLIDKINLQHGKMIHKSKTSPNTYSFTRDDLGMLVDFMGGLMQKSSNAIIGVRGMPQVGKTEAIIAACVHANKKWVLVSSTMMRQVIRGHLMDDELNSECVLVIDGIVSSLRSNENHKKLVDEIIRLPIPKVIEHPDIFLRENDYTSKLIDYTVELRRSEDEEINYEFVNQSFSSFDIS
ncbi:DUF3388 domain-containing protein [Proteinivorax hydrogeniformans]|uniref:DUF3388 domain-containing protein n=1 Tax=Proteinivorax hydrogeniformans TaxID=1826727 RepID=A0AAU8HPT8_9FIRM